MPLRLLPLLAVATVAVAVTPQPTRRSPPRRARPRSAPNGGWAAWSSYDTATSRFAPTLERDGKITSPAVATSKGPFDVSIGPDAGGAPVALYTRAPTGARRTRDVYRLDLRSVDERRLSLSSPAFDEHAPTQWRSGLAFARKVKRRSGSKTFSCDVPYLRIGGRSRRLDRGHCASVTGQLLRATTLLQTTDADRSRNGGNSVPTRSEIRSVTRSRGSRLLIRQGSGEESNLFGGLGADGSFVYSSRFGTQPDSSFVRIDRRTGAVRETPAQTKLAGGLALDAGRLTYLELQGTFRGGDCGTANPCRVVRASADPFGPEARPLASPPRPTSRASTELLGHRREGDDRRRRRVRPHGSGTAAVVLVLPGADGRARAHGRRRAGGRQREGRRRAEHLGGGRPEWRTGDLLGQCRSCATRADREDPAADQAQLRQELRWPTVRPGGFRDGRRRAAPGAARPR